MLVKKRERESRIIDVYFAYSTKSRAVSVEGKQLFLVCFRLDDRRKEMKKEKGGVRVFEKENEMGIFFFLFFVFLKEGEKEEDNAQFESLKGWMEFLVHNLE